MRCFEQELDLGSTENSPVSAFFIWIYFEFNNMFTPQFKKMTLMENTTPVERFVTFMPNQGHKAQEMYDGLTKFLTLHGIDMQNCRGQTYDNASAMSGRYNGLQAKVLCPMTTLQL